MIDENMTEADYIEDGADYLEEHQCEPCADCRGKECSTYCVRYDEWFWSR